jgi:hypothetical protein
MEATRHLSTRRRCPMSVGFPFAFGSARVRLALLAVAVVGLGSLVIVARARLTHHARVEAVAPEQDHAAAAVAQSKSPETRIISHLLTLSPRGFDPAEVSWPKGRFFLTIDNRSNVSELVLRLDRVAGGRVKEINLKSKKERSAGVLDLHPGEYLLTEANHPGWVCRIKITPQ